MGRSALGKYSTVTSPIPLQRLYRSKKTINIIVRWCSKTYLWRIPGSTFSRPWTGSPSPSEMSCGRLRVEALPCTSEPRIFSNMAANFCRSAADPPVSSIWQLLPTAMLSLLSPPVISSSQPATVSLPSDDTHQCPSKVIEYPSDTSSRNEKKGETYIQIES